jgi:LemA protein
VTVVVIVVAVVLLAAAGWLLLTYNGLVRRRLRVENAWSQIDVVLRQRHDLIPNLVQAVRDYTSYERGIVDDVTAARERAVKAGGVAEQAHAERELTEGVGRLLAVAEAYPDLKASGNFLALQQQLGAAEGRIAVARQVYNDTVQTYNEKVQTMPTAFVAARLGFTSREFFDAAPAERAVPAVAL